MIAGSADVTGLPSVRSLCDAAPSVRLEARDAVWTSMEVTKGHPKRRAGMALTVLLVAVGSYVAGRLVSTGDEGEPTRADPAGPGAAAAAADAGAAQSVRAQVRRIVREEVEGLATREEVEAYLDRLVERARARGAVTALDVEPGFAAIDQIAPEMGAESAERLRWRFDNRMMELGTELEAGAGDEGGGP